MVGVHPFSSDIKGEPPTRRVFIVVRLGEDIDSIRTCEEEEEPWQRQQQQLRCQQSVQCICQWYEGPKLRDFLLGCEPEKTTLQAEVVREIMNLTHDYFPSRGWRGEMLYSPVYRFQSQEGIIRPLVENQRRPTAD
ncbi:uncharacterized protein [Branchiostoma lanceolatum]|uniref:uncharacterized protein isoform X2 n=1 Tax=Branchiostoma lanceolatum TaxID=7740 RepID=UPI0034571F1F